MRIRGESPTVVARLHAGDEDTGFVGERHWRVLDARESFRRLEPCGIAFEADAGDVIVRQPPRAGEILEHLAAAAVAQTNGAVPRSNPRDRR